MVNEVFIPRSSRVGSHEKMFRTDGTLVTMEESDLPVDSPLKYLGQILEIHDSTVVTPRSVLEWNVYEVMGGPFDGEEVHAMVGSPADAKIY